MKKTCTICLICCLTIGGCLKRGDIYYSVTIRNRSNEELNLGLVEGWRGVLFSGSNPGTGGVCDGLEWPVPDEVTITWKSVRHGMEEAAKKHSEQAGKELEQYLKDKDASKLSDSYPPELYEDHKVVLVLKEKVPKRPYGEIYITYMGDEKFEVAYKPKTK